MGAVLPGIALLLIGSGFPGNGDHDIIDDEIATHGEAASVAAGIGIARVAIVAFLTKTFLLHSITAVLPSALCAASIVAPCIAIIALFARIQDGIATFPSAGAPP